MTYVGLLVAQLGEKATHNIQNKLMKLVVPILLYTFFLNPSLLITLFIEGLSIPTMEAVAMPVVSMSMSGLFFKTGEWYAKKTIGKCFPANEVKAESQERKQAQRT
ncbi:MAG: hypothetical protein AAGB33_00005 [Cellulomonas sp.]|nr:hypothetical protein [Rickettsiella sp.]